MDTATVDRIRSLVAAFSRHQFDPALQGLHIHAVYPLKITDHRVISDDV